MGQVDAATASELLGACDLGLPTIQRALLGKSGTAAAFLEHGVPLVATSNDWTCRSGNRIEVQPEKGITCWSEASAFDWGQTLSERPLRNGRTQQCVEGWRNCLAEFSRDPARHAAVHATPP
jgi:hypothetical protein